MRKLVLFAAALSLCGCTFMVAGEDNFRKVADSQSGVVDKPLEEVFRCFVAKGINPGYQQLYPDSGTAVWSFTKGITYGAMADFTRISPTQTKVTVLGLREGDWTLHPDNIWKARVAPCM